jgi:uncharacterized membrane protein YidH (DUF202 family)
MFNLEESILEWRRQMLDVGLKNPNVLDELESHLREEAERQVKLGLAPQDAFETAVERIGQPKTLNDEFKKITGIKRIKHSLLMLAGIPNHYLMNTSGPNSNIQPGWATYLKAALFVVPAFFLWGLAMVKVVPALQSVSAGSTTWPAFSRFNIGIAALIRDHFLYLVSGVILALILLEWRSAIWRRYRRAVIGLTAFVLNFSLLVSLFLILVTAALVAERMAHSLK